MIDELKPLIESIERNNSFFLVSHIDPDGDAIGSLIAVAELLERKGKKVVAYDRDGVPEIYRFLKGAGRVVSTLPEGGSEKGDFDVAIFLECPNTTRAGAECLEFVEGIPEWINLDHHHENAQFGRINIVKTELCAVGEMIYELYQAMDEPISEVVAEALYTAIMTDTGSYKYSNTSARCHDISARLIELGARPYNVYQEVFERLSPQAALISARAHATLEIEDKIACITVTRKMLEEVGATAEDTHDVVSYGRAIAGVEVALLFRETESDIKVSLRAKNNIDVSKIAGVFDGGGHKKAAGCNIKGTMEEVKAKIFAAVRKALAEKENGETNGS